MGCNLSFLGGNGEGEEEEKRVLFLGLDGAGKTSLLFKMKDDDFKDTTPTVGLNVESIKYKEAQITLWDVSGAARKLWKHYYDKVDGIIFVIDSTDRSRLRIAKAELVKAIADDSLKDVPCLVLANKQDADGAM